VRIDIIVYDGFDELDAIAPYEVLRSAAAAGADFDVRLVAHGQTEVRAAFGLRVPVDGPFDGQADVIVVPGGGWAARAGTGAWAEYRRGDWLPLLRQAFDRGAVLAGVCTGGMLLAHAGVIGGRRAATHHSAWAELEATGAELVRDRVVDDGQLVTAGGVTSGIDLGLWLVERFAGRDHADRAAERLEYRRERPATLEA
jgi:transcriptional regulator GlxA family with amidase domain